MEALQLNPPAPAALTATQIWPEAGSKGAESGKQAKIEDFFTFEGNGNHWLAPLESGHRQGRIESEKYIFLDITHKVKNHFIHI